jgi:hypothetical protein
MYYLQECIGHLLKFWVPLFSLDYLIEILGDNVGATFFSEYRTLRPSVSRNASSKLLSLTQFDSFCRM